MRHELESRSDSSGDIWYDISSLRKVFFDILFEALKVQEDLLSVTKCYVCHELQCTRTMHDFDKMK